MESSKAVSLTDIAREVGVSAMTVSAVLNGNNINVHVSEDTRSRVMEAVQRLQYRPNASDRVQSSKRTNTIGVIAALTYPGDMNIVLHHLLNGILEGSVLYGQRIILYHIIDWEKDEKRILDFCDGSADGFILSAPKLSESIASQLYQAIPIIAIHNMGELSDAINVDIDNELAVYEVIKYLITLGHSRIGNIVGAMKASGSIERLNGYRRALSDSGIQFDQRLVAQGRNTLQSGRLAAEELLARFEGKAFPTAVFCSNDVMAWGAISVFRERGLRVPEDISVVGFDGTQIDHLFSLRLTTVRQPLSSMGVYAVSMLVQAIDEKMGTVTKQRTDVAYPNSELNERMFMAVSQFGNTALFPPELIIRDTVADLTEV